LKNIWAATMADVIESARTLKSRAMDARDRRDFAGAIRLLSEARAGLESELRDLEPKRADKGSPGRFEQEVAAQLAHILGSMGGVYRRAKDYPASIESYDAGYRFEDPGAPYGIVNSYNLTQRLVSRVFMNPHAVDEAGVTVQGLPLWDELEAAEREIERQRTGKRRHDEYAAADLATVALLKGDADWRDKLDAFLYSKPKPQPYAIEVTLDVLASLRERLSETSEASPELTSRVTEACEEISREIGA
jgi:hypothetical protein